MESDEEVENHKSAKKSWLANWLPLSRNKFINFAAVWHEALTYKKKRNTVGLRKARYTKYARGERGGGVFFSL